MKKNGNESWEAGNRVLVNEHADVYASKLKQHLQFGKFEHELAASIVTEPAQFAFKTSHLIDPHFRRIDLRSEINADTSCTLEQIQNDTAKGGVKKSVSASMVVMNRHRLQSDNLSRQKKLPRAEATGEIHVSGYPAVPDFFPEEFEPTFRRGEHNYVSHLSQDHCCWEDLESAGVV